MNSIWVKRQDSFRKDPFGQAASGWFSLAYAANRQGVDIDPAKFPTIEQLNTPVLWLTQAQALYQAAVVIMKSDPDLTRMDLVSLQEIVAAQMQSVVLMLVGYSLEACLKGCLIYTKGYAEYISEADKHQIHQLQKLSNYFPLDKRDLVILELLTKFTLWAGRYPTPKQHKDSEYRNIYDLSEKHKITGKELFDVAHKVMTLVSHKICPRDA